VTEAKTSVLDSTLEIDSKRNPLENDIVKGDGYVLCSVVFVPSNSEALGDGVEANTHPQLIWTGVITVGGFRKTESSVEIIDVSNPLEFREHLECPGSLVQLL
jgi:hypothetical protein